MYPDADEGDPDDEAGERQLKRERAVVFAELRNFTRLSEVLAAPLGIALRNGAVLRVFEQNSRLPTKKTVLVPVRAGEAINSRRTRA